MNSPTLSGTYLAQAELGGVALEAGGHSHMVETQEPAPGKGNVDIPSVVARHPAAALSIPTALH